jgi:hypothetical protein
VVDLFTINIYLSMVNYEEQSDRFTYDVFLSFRGEDTRETIVGYLRRAFEKRGIKVFYDDKNLRIGEDISPALCKAIEESNISVIVLSEDYASSRWCLGELVKIMECTERNKKQIVFPIFYHVDPSDVRHQRKSYGEAIVAHQKRFGKHSEKIKAWTAALSQVADLKGHHVHTGYVTAILLLYMSCQQIKLHLLSLELYMFCSHYFIVHGTPYVL